MYRLKKALILSLCIHLLGLFGVEILLKRTKPNRRQVLYPIHLIEIAESSPKPIIQNTDLKKEKKASQPPPTIPKAVKKEVTKKPPEPKKGVPVKKIKEKKRNPAKDQEKKGEAEKEKTPKKAIKEEEIKRVSQAIEQIKKALVNKAQEQQSTLISKEFIERQKQIYATRIDQLIKANWSIPKTFLMDMGDLEAIVVLRIKPNGELEDARLEKRSGFHPFDESTIRAIKKAAPFPPPPVDLKDDEFEIRFYSNQMG